MFPYEQVPDGNILTSHHYTYAMLAIMFVLAIIWDNYDRREPLLGAGAALMGLFAFIFVWPQHHVVGALMALAAPGIVILGTSFRLLTQTVLAVKLGIGEDLYPWYWFVIVILLALFAYDDVLQHALGWETPADMFWKEHLRPALPSH